MSEHQGANHAGWIRLDTNESIDAFLDACGGFHDACFREALIAGETYVDNERGMHCEARLETSVRMVFQSQGAAFGAFEVECTGVSLLRLSPTPDNCDSILTAGVVTRLDDSVRLALAFLGGPLVGPPNGFLVIPARTPDQTPDIEVVAKTMAWRRLEPGTGPLRHFGPTTADGKLSERLMRMLTRLATLSLVLGALAVTGAHLSLPTPIRATCEAFASPGEFLWWTVWGGAFSGYPQGTTGLAVWIVGTAAFWFVVLVAVTTIVRSTRRKGSTTYRSP